jgi:hypothetical protein
VLLQQQQSSRLHKPKKKVVGFPSPSISVIMKGFAAAGEEATFVFVSCREGL